MISHFVFYIFIFIFLDFLLLLLGLILFYLGKLFNNAFLIRIGHTIMAYFSSGCFGITSSWLSRNCPNKKCYNCRFWTCGLYCKKDEFR